ncbi:MAG: response regulator [Steroidobacteraceae bacterium]
MITKPKVLVIDDEEVVRNGFARALESDQCNVAQSGSGPVGLETLDRERFDVVLLDLRMPEMDGVEVLGQIKKRWPETEVIVITGYPAVDTAKEAVRLGAYDYLAKPVGCDEVARVTHRAMQHKQWAMRSVAAA